ncbi:DUF6086 family protein [Actinacidiphila rubida]|uniref:Uncharacterized protein n=1 Tax=Actinacidiphila rubida TaxID=310780 RepID=A0A1H8G385_9ACTN|nr:DUF6086 family protein [Actinacidiphila rubida]SEN37748.1 hypothetical protein SAMN05216267_1004201 [Actinacidiphila rubida]
MSSDGAPEGARFPVSHTWFRTGPTHSAAGTGLWRPDDRVAVLFLGHAALLADLLRAPSGCGDVVNGECRVDDSLLEAFCSAALAEYGATEQGIQRTLTVGLIATALVLLDRAGRPVPGSVVPEQQAAWAALRDQHSAVMPR